MNSKKFKKEQRPSACTQPPWAVFIPPMQRAEILRKIRQEVIDEIGHSLDECPKRMVCLKKTCMGRPLPWMSETAKPYLEKLGVKEGEDYYVKTDCSACPLFKDCSSPCNQVLDYIEKDKVLEPIVHYENYREDIHAEEEPIEPSKTLISKEDIPWDILSERKKTVVKRYLEDQRDFRSVAEFVGLYNQAAAKYEFYSALNKLSEYGIMKKFVKENATKLTPRQHEILSMVYLNNKKMVTVAEELEISKQSVQQTVSRVIKKFNIKWHKFVTKKNKKTIYNTVNVLKI